MQQAKSFLGVELQFSVTSTGKIKTWIWDKLTNVAQGFIHQRRKLVIEQVRHQYKVKGSTEANSQSNRLTWNTVSSPGRISGKWKEADSEPAMMSIQQTKTSVGKRRSYVCSLPNSGNSEASPLSAATPAYLQAFTPGGWNCQQCTHSSTV